MTQMTEPYIETVLVYLLNGMKMQQMTYATSLRPSLSQLCEKHIEVSAVHHERRSQGITRTNNKIAKITWNDWNDIWAPWFSNNLDFWKNYVNMVTRCNGEIRIFTIKWLNIYILALFGYICDKILEKYLKFVWFPLENWRFSCSACLMADWLVHWGLNTKVKEST